LPIDGSRVKSSPGISPESKTPIVKQEFSCLVKHIDLLVPGEAHSLNFRNDLRWTMDTTIQTLKNIIKGVPGFGPFLVRLREKQWNSSDYWELRYRRGGNSGAGSYNRLAEFKAAFLNSFVAQQQITSVIEFGSGDGFQLKLARYPQYIGVDVSVKAIELCRSAFLGDTSKHFLHSDAFAAGTCADLALSLDVIYHLVEDDIYEAYMRRLFRCAERFVIVYSSNVNQNAPSRHIRHREFTKWVEQNEPYWYLHSCVMNAYPYDAADPDHTSFADFYVFAPHELIENPAA
jgi:hypothetical protein